MTGCFPTRVDITRVLFPGEPYGLNPAEYTMPQMFHDAGYATMIVGKWHCGDQPESLPCRFDSTIITVFPTAMIWECSRGRIRTFSRCRPLPLVSGDEVIEQQPDQESLTERYVEQCIRFMRKNKDTPLLPVLCPDACPPSRCMPPTILSRLPRKRGLRRMHGQCGLVGGGAGGGTKALGPL